jgi:hypothetical protein
MYNKSNRIYGLGLSCGCYSNWVRTSDEGKAMIERATLKATKPRKELEKATKTHNNSKGLTTLIKGVVKICHEYIRLRDKFKPCISCGTSWNSDFQAGHFKKAEKFTTIKLHEHNINGQCQQCNLRKDGNESEYSIRLPDRIGKDNYKELVRLADLDHSVDFHWDREVLKGIRKDYQTKLKELKQ